MWNFKHLLIIFLIPILWLDAEAKIYPKVNFPITGTLLMDYTGSPLDISTSYPGITSANLALLNTPNRITSYQNTVELLLKNHSAFIGNAKVTVKANLKYFLINNSSPVTKQITLEVNYRSGALVKTGISNIYAFSNAYKVELSITNIVVTPDAGVGLAALKTKLKDFIELNIGFQEERITRINYNTFPTGLSACENESTDELTLSWNPIPDAESYELEYTFVDDYGTNYIMPASPTSLRFNFKENSTRVSTKEIRYSLPLVFERGYILYRVRAVGVGGTGLGLPVYCRWTGAEKGNVAAFLSKYYHHNAHSNDKINWTTTATFAEDGKRSDAANYFDGTFRSRQTVTGLNIERQLPYKSNLLVIFDGSNCPLAPNKEREVIAGETIYDYQGRPAVSIMPVPTNSLKLEYLPLLNISDATHKPYSWQDFDKPNFTCAPATTKLFNNAEPTTGIMGAGAYYSANNPKKLGFNAFIPDGGGFPFTQNSYLQDNTERVAAQTSPGASFQFGSGHETKYYYAAPNQEELDRMFGTEAGDALRYKKNAVVDANGQVSVSYLNPEGKTIATALAGITPTNLDALSSQVQNTINISLMNKNIINTDNKTMIAEHQFVVTSDNTEYTFDYSINPETLQNILCNGDKVYLDGIYDIEITLKHVESCTSVALENHSGTIGTLLNQGTVDLQFNNTNITRQIKRILGIGTYIITKKVTVNEQAAIAYADKLMQDTCRSKWDAILLDELSRVDTLNCYKSCTTCAIPPVQSPVCDTVYCKPNPNRCDLIRSMLQADLSPGGQYGQFVRNANGTIDASAYPLSIFNPANLLPVQQINLSLFGSAITSISDLVNNWKPAYAELLLPMHPEYCMLGWCSSTNVNATLNFDAQVLSTQHFGDAVTKGYLTIGSSLPNNNTPAYQQLLNSDPWFANGQNAAMKATLLGKLQHYGCAPATFSADELAIQMAWCANANPVANQQGTPAMNVNGPQCTPPANYLGTHGFGTNPALADLEWTFLRSLYMSAKNELIQASMTTYADANNCNSRCIGTSDYHAWGRNFPNFQNFVNVLPCQTAGRPFVWMLYADKQSRFSTGIGNIMNMVNEAGIAIDLSSVTNLNDPCQFSQAIINQSGSINQQTANTLCAGGGSDDGCKTIASLTNLINDIIVRLRTNNTVSMSQAQLSPDITAIGITGVVAQYIGANGGVISIKLAPCITLIIDKAPGNSTAVPALSVCCITNVSCVGTNCSFDLKVLYPNNVSNIIRVRSTCMVPTCTETVQRACTQPTVYTAAVKTYLNDIFNFRASYATPISSAQLSTLAPSTLRNNNTLQSNGVTLNTSGNLTLTLNYGTPGKNCTIVLQQNATIGNWSNVKSVISITPDLTGVQNGITNNFILQVLSGTSINNLTTVTVKGTSSCWAMNQCPPAQTLCDSVPVMPEYPLVNNCVKDQLALAYSNASQRYSGWADSIRTDLMDRYYEKCLSAVETFNMKYDDRQYHYTLYYFDQAGNLAKTVPPAGVKLLDGTQALAVASSRAAGYSTPVIPSHFKTTVYRYNTLNELIWQKTPDAGESNFFYDGLGRIAASQNAQQQLDGNIYSYTRYDLLGRTFESGKVKSNTTINATLTRNFSNWSNFITGQPNRTEITFTRYDASLSSTISTKFGTSGQQNLRNRVASVFSFANKAALDNTQYIHATHYTYDIMGNVYKLIQDYPNGIIGDKTIDYTYDLQSGKVNQVSYQKGKIDQFLHSYTYDALNRLTEVKTSTNNLIWETDATYKYYRHGPLARTELGTDKVQGLDYMYTLQGWIKGVNGTTDKVETDMGQDGITAPPASPPPVPYTYNGITFNVYNLSQLFGSSFNGPGYGTMHNPVARDAFGYVLGYYKGDYTAIQSNGNLTGFQLQAGMVKPLYNGNISRMYTQLQTLGNNGYNYTYDQLNRITSQHAWKITGTNMAMLPSDAYGSTFSYDGDGNIMKQLRNGTAASPAMDNLSYFYYTQNNSIYNPTSGIPTDATNKLAHVKDPVSAGNYPTDLDGQNTGNYKYDLNGNLISDAKEQISNIVWSLHNKILKIIKNSGPNLYFQYDAFGNRVMKNVIGGTAAQNMNTFYVRDAQGNAMATYTYKIPASGGTLPKLHWSEATIYGSSRVGLVLPDMIIPVVSSAPNVTNNVYYSIARGQKNYELTNHLGNVLATITDRKIPSTGIGAVVYTADLVGAQDYYAFGMEMPDRSFSSGNYRYGFGGQEKVDEISGSGNSYTAEYWQYDPRLGRRWNNDPIMKPWESPYATFSNNPIYYNDPLGLDASQPVKPGDGNGTAGSTAPNGGTRKGDGSVSGGDAICPGCGKNGEDIYGLPSAENNKSTSILQNTSSIISNFLDNLANNWKNSEFTAQVSGKLDIGVQAKLNATDLVKVKADLVSYELLKGKLDFVKMFDKNNYSDEDDSVVGTYIGENGVNVEQGIEAEVGFKNFGLGGAFKHTFNTNNPRNSNVDYDILIGVPVLKKTSDKMIEKIISKTAKEAMAPFDPISSPKLKGGKKQNFFGLDLGFGAALILGIDINIKLGFEY